MKHLIPTLLVASLLVSCATSGRDASVKTNFQIATPWRPSVDVRADAVMVYGVGGNPSEHNPWEVSFEDRVASWKERGYVTHFMTGIAWGSYQDYFTGAWDGVPHLDEGQVRQSGDTVWHGHMVPYIVPTRNYLEYFKERVIRRVIDAGIDHIFLEEPEFWAFSGYSESFKREWEEYYGFPWRPQHESPEATWLSNKLKYHLYYRALDETFSYAKQYGKSKGLDVKCFVPTHSLLSYTQIRMVSPEASLASLPSVDGYIGQIWTGTSRGPNFYRGKRAERVFEMAYLEYGCMESMVAPTGRRVWFLTDPIEDWPRDWEDYHRNYHATYVAQMLYPGIADYEVMPWPNRIYEGLYRRSPDSEEQIPIPADYATMMQHMIGASQQMPLSGNEVSGSHGVNILMGNSLMFQSFPNHKGYRDPDLSNFFGLAMPLVKRGVPVGITHIENVGYKAALKDVKVLIMTYSNMKPLEPGAHKYIADWVRRGGRLVYCATDKDPFQHVMEWWNTGDNHFDAPSDHLFALMDIPAGASEGEYAWGRGSVTVLRHDPKEFVLREGGEAKFVETVDRLYGGLQLKNSFLLQRGPYTLAAVMDESVSDAPLHLEGLYIDVFDPQLPVYDGATVLPGTQRMFLSLDRAGKAPRMLSTAGRAYGEKVTGRSYSCVVKAPASTVNTSRILLPGRPETVLINGKSVPVDWDGQSKTLFLRFDNDPEGVALEISW